MIHEERGYTAMKTINALRTFDLGGLIPLAVLAALLAFAAI